MKSYIFLNLLTLQVTLLSNGIQSDTFSYVFLSSSLNGRSTAYHQQMIRFTCETRGSDILAWSSEDYIGEGVLLEFTFIDRPGSIQSHGNAIATFVSVANESGQRVLTSTLQITVSSQFSTSSVTCHNIGSGAANSTTFNVADEPAQEVNCTLRQGLTACPGDQLNFICVTRDSEILAWSSDEYIGQSSLLEFTSLDRPGTSLRSTDPNTNAVAVLTNVSQDNFGVLVITCNLTITVLPSIDRHGHSVTCMNIGVGTRNITTFQRAGNCGKQEITTRTSAITSPDQIIIINGVGIPWNSGPHMILSCIMLSYTLWVA